MQVGETAEGGTPMMTPDEGRREGAARRDEGVERAAARREWEIQRATLAFLDAIRQRPDRTATTDDLSRNCENGGRWRGSVPKRLARQGLIKAVGAMHSARPARHKGLLTRWRAVDEKRYPAQMCRTPTLVH